MNTLSVLPFLTRSSGSVAVLLIACTILFSVAAESSEFPQRMDRAESQWRDWVKRIGATQSQWAIAYEGKILRKRHIGVASDKPLQLASLSKAITGACVLALEQQGMLRRKTTLADMADKLNGLDDLDISNAKISVADLLTHTSGLNPDITQGRIHNWLDRKSSRLTKITREALQSENRQGKRGAYFYNNANYSALGLMIEAASGKDYTTACKQALSPLSGSQGLSISPALRAIPASGGWQATAADFLTFANAAFGKGTTIQADRLSLPHVALGGGAYYGPGVVFRPNRTRGTNVWHFGLLCNPDKKHDSGSYFAVLGDTWSIAVIHNACPAGNAAFDIDGLMVQALFGPL